MTHAIGRAVATACSPRLGAAWAALFYAWHPALAVEFDRDVPRNLRASTRPSATRCRGSRLARRGRMLPRPRASIAPVSWTLDLRGPRRRAAREENPDLIIPADGVMLRDPAHVGGVPGRAAH
jgi:hypothetical protein